MEKRNHQSIRNVAGGLFVALIVIMAATNAIKAQVMSGDKYSITSSVVANGGGASTGDNKKIEGTAGQSAAGGPYSGGLVSHTAGFWASSSSAASPTPTPS